MAVILVLALEEGSANECDNEETEEDPEGAIVIQISSFVHDLGFRGVVTWEEESPSTHEQVGTNHGG